LFLSDGYIDEVKNALMICVLFKPKTKNSTGDGPVFVKVVVRFIHAAFNKTSSSARISFGGFSHTSVIWLQSLISPDQRLGLRLFACL
jgi:hypothetical protein